MKKKNNALDLTHQAEYRVWVELFVYCLRQNEYLSRYFFAQKEGDALSLIKSNLLYWKKFDPAFFKALVNDKQSRLKELFTTCHEEIPESEQSNLELEVIVSKVTVLEALIDDFQEFIDCDEQELFNRLYNSDNGITKIGEKLILPNSQNPQAQIVRGGKLKQSIGNQGFIEDDCLILKLPLGQEVAESKKIAELLIQGAYYHGGENISSREFTKRKSFLIPNHLARIEYENHTDKKRGWIGDYQFCPINRDLNQYITILLCWHLYNRERMSKKEIAIFLVQHQDRVNDQYKLIGYQRKFPQIKYNDDEFLSLFSENSAEYRQANLFKYVCKWINAGQQIVDNIATASFPLHKPLA